LKTIAPRLPQAVSNRARSMPLSSPGTCCRYTRQSRRTCDPARLVFQRSPHQGKRQQAEKGQRVPDLLSGCAFCDILCTGHFANLGTVFSRKYSVPRVLVWPTFIVGKANAGAGVPTPACQRISCILYSISRPQLETLTAGGLCCVGIRPSRERWGSGLDGCLSSPSPQHLPPLLRTGLGEGIVRSRALRLREVPSSLGERGSGFSHSCASGGNTLGYSVWAQLGHRPWLNWASERSKM